MTNWLAKTTKGIWSKLKRKYKKAKKLWLSIGGGTFALACLYSFNGIGVIADISSLMSDTASSEQVGAVGTALDTLATEQGESFKGLNDKLDATLNCKNLANDWSVENAFNIDNQYILLKEGVEAGSVRFFKAFKDTFVLKFTFIPDVVQGTNGIFSIKDEMANELRISISDDISENDYDSDLDYFEIKLITAGGVEINLNIGSSSQILPIAKSGEEIMLQVQTSQMATGLNANAFMVYTPAQKINEKSYLNLINTEIPNFENKSVRLNLGMRRIKDAYPGIKIVDCVIQQVN